MQKQKNKYCMTTTVTTTTAWFAVLNELYLTNHDPIDSSEITLSP